MDTSDAKSFKITFSPAYDATPSSANVAMSISTAGVIRFDNAYSFPIADGTVGQTLVTNGAGVLSFGSNSALLSYTNVTTTPYVVLASDEYLSIDTSTAKTIQLPNTTSTGRVIIIKDRTGTASLNNISVTTVGGVVTVDTVTTYTITNDFGAINLIFNGTNYEVY